MIKVQRFGMANKPSPLGLAGPVCRLTLNAELPTPGVCRKRRGIVTDLDIDMQVGTVAPYHFFCWQVGGTMYRIACGADGEAFVNGFNNYLYIRSAAAPNGVIYSDAEAAPHVVRAGWGLPAPTGGLMSVAAATLSCLGAGYFRMAVASFDPATWCESPAVFLKGTQRTGLYTDWHTDEMQQIFGVSEAIAITAVTSGAGGTKIRFYRGNPMGGSEWPTVPPYEKTPFRFLRLVEELASPATLTDKGGQPEGRILDYATTVVPRCCSAVFHMDRWWQTRSAAGDQKVYYSRGVCPETYAAVDYALLQDVRDGLERGIADFFVPTDCGVVTGQVAQGNQHLILCRYGSWPVQRGREVGRYEAGRNLWIGCVSEATLANSPWGWWWLAEEGIVLWDGQGPPQILSLKHLDIEDADTLFATDLSAASAAFDVRHKRYVVCVPTSGGGQVILTVQADLLPEEFALSVWTLADDAKVGLGSVKGMGYDWEAGEVVFILDAGQGSIAAKSPKTGCWRDGVDAAGGLTYDFKLEPWALANQGGAGPGEQKADLGLRVIIHREEVTVAQSIAVELTGMKSGDEAETPTQTGTITWAAGERMPKRYPGPTVQGRLVKAVLTNTDIYPLEIREVQIGTGQELKEADERPG